MVDFPDFGGRKAAFFCPLQYARRFRSIHRMSSSWLKFHVVLLVASLQCFAPLIHAHTHGTPAGHDIHMYGEETGVVADGVPSLHVVSAEQHHGPAIGVAKEYKHDHTLPFFDVFDLGQLLAFPHTVAFVSDFRRSFSAPRIRFTRPSPQAP